MNLFLVRSLPLTFYRKRRRRSEHTIFVGRIHKPASDYLAEKYDIRFAKLLSLTRFCTGARLHFQSAKHEQRYDDRCLE
jgi:hypothetical protein